MSTTPSYLGHAPSERNVSEKPTDKLFELVRKLEDAKIFFTLRRNRTDGISIEAVVPGQRWEIDVLEDGDVAFEVFRSDGSILDEAKLEEFIEQWREE